MPLDPSTVLARTAVGEGELLKPTHGLALGQRRLLTQLSDPRAFDELVEEHALDAAKTERDLIRLAHLGLVALHSPASADAASFAQPMQTDDNLLEISDNPTRRRRWPLMVGGAAALVASLAWMALRPGNAPPPRVDAPPAPAAVVKAT